MIAPGIVVIKSHQKALTDSTAMKPYKVLVRVGQQPPHSLSQPQWGDAQSSSCIWASRGLPESSTNRDLVLKFGAKTVTVVK